MFPSRKLKPRIELIEERDILLFLEDRADSEIQDSIEKWLKEDSANQQELDDLKELNALSNELKGYVPFDSSNAWKNISAELDFDDALSKPDGAQIIRLHKRVRQRNYTAIAASFLVLLLAGLIAYNQRPQMIELATSTESKNNIQLPDGSIADINPGTILRYSSKMHKQDVRSVYVYGKARFDVVSDPERPFIVNTEATGTRVLGTIFEVESVSEEAIVANEEGLVNFFSLADTSVATLVKEGETFKFDGSAFEEVVEELPPPPPPPGKVMNVLDMIDSLEYYYPTTFEIKPYISEDQFLDSVRVDLSQDLQWAVRVLDSFSNVNLDFDGERCIFYGTRQD